MDIVLTPGSKSLDSLLVIVVELDMPRTALHHPQSYQEAREFGIEVTHRTHFLFKREAKWVLIHPTVPLSHLSYPIPIAHILHFPIFCLLAKKLIICHYSKPAWRKRCLSDLYLVLRRYLAHSPSISNAFIQVLDSAPMYVLAAWISSSTQCVVKAVE